MTNTGRLLSTSSSIASAPTEATLKERALKQRDAIERRKRLVRDAIPQDPQHTSTDLQLLDQIGASDDIELKLASHITMLDAHVTECFKQANELPPDDHKYKLLNMGIKLMLACTRQIEALAKYQNKGQQNITVQHVQVEAGGQAIVGNVQAAGKPDSIASDHAASGQRGDIK